ncbi:MAG: toluene transporter subunit: ATP-binding component of superfamily [Pseudomonadota bacterium]|jgi:phospholipid/cholesterol/gamma-HCH transport system ATP-binding protein
MATPPSEPLAFRDVVFRRDGRLILDRVSLSVSSGETVALLGPSGAGKTTLFRLALGFLKPDSGEVWVNGREISGLGERALFDVRANVGIVFQDGALFTSMTVAENVGFGMAETELSEDDIRARVEKTLGHVGMETFADRMPDELSGGQAQRVAVARAIAAEPRVMLYDEPTQGLDPVRSLDVVEQMRRLARAGVASLAVTHQFEYARLYADRVALLEDGRIRYDGPVAGLRGLDDDFIQSFFRILDVRDAASGGTDASA